MKPLNTELLEEHHAFIKSDNPWQQRARLLQALWREKQGLPIGDHRGNPLGSRLAMPYAKDTLANYLTETIRDAVRAEVLGTAAKGKLFAEPRIWNDLLSSQPLCFNLFGELQADLDLAQRTLGQMGVDADVVTRVTFEHSPGRSDSRFLDDKSAFDVFVEYETKGQKAFLGIEVKYHENLANSPGKHRERYSEVAEAMGCFSQSAEAELQKKPLQQIWRDHLLAGSLVLADVGYDHGTFVFLYPAANECCASALIDYQGHLTNSDTFVSVRQ